MKQLLLAVLVLVLVAGCASTQKKIAKHNIPQEIVIQRSTEQKDRPVWVHEAFTFKEDNGIYYFSGGVDRGHDFALSIRQAKAEAMKNLAESVAMKIRQEFTEMVEGDNQNSDIGRSLSDGIAWVVDNFYVTGVKLKDVYYERIYNTGNAAVSYTAFALLEITQADYSRSREDAIRKLMGYFNRQKQYDAEKRAKELLERLLKEETI
jgi:hypothetical protein